MVIKRIKICNFRSIEKATLEVDKFNVFVGQNNHGKTNLFEAVEWFFNGSGEMIDICFMKNIDLEVSVEVEFIGLQKALNSIANEKQRKAISDIFGTQDSIVIQRNSKLKEGQERYLLNPKKTEWENPMGRDTAWRQFLPTLEYVSTKKFLEDVAKYGKATPISKMLSAVLERMLETDTGYANFKKQFNELFGDPEDPEQKTSIRQSIDKIGGSVANYLQKQFPDCTEVKFKVENPELEDLFKKFRTSVNDGIENDSSEKGDGMQRALMLAIIQAYANFRKASGESIEFLFLIDEAELHLHPTAQRALKSALLEVAKAGDQVLVNTHSSVLVVDDHENQRIFKVEKINRVSNIIAITDKERPYIIYELLGGSPADLLLPRNFLIVEGKTEFELLSRVIARLYADRPPIHIIQANGDMSQTEKSFNSIEKLFQPLEKSIYRETVVILIDKQKDTALMNKFLATYPSLRDKNQFFQIPTSHIEEYYPESWRMAVDSKGKLDFEKKIELRCIVGDQITKEQFESDMAIIYKSLSRCWELAF